MPLMKLVLDLFFIFFLIGYSSHKSRILFAELRVFCFSVGITLPKLALLPGAYAELPHRRDIGSI